MTRGEIRQQVMSYESNTYTKPNSTFGGWGTVRQRVHQVRPRWIFFSVKFGCHYLSTFCKTVWFEVIQTVVRDRSAMEL